MSLISVQKVPRFLYVMEVDLYGDENIEFWSECRGSRVGYSVLSEEQAKVQGKVQGTR